MTSRLAAVAGAVVLGLLATGAHAAPRPVPLTYYLHGVATYDDLESNKVRGGYLPMDTVKPTTPEPKSKQVINYAAGPDVRCAGNVLMPTWSGPLAGTVTGDVKVTFTALGLPGAKVDVQLFADIDSQRCDSPAPAGTATVALPTSRGKVTVVLKNVKLKARTSFLLHIAPARGGIGNDPVSQGRIYYDSAADASSVSFTCLPSPGRSTC